MRISVLSDTHSHDLPTKVIEDLKGSDLIIHVGDFCTVGDYKKIAALKETKAVYGNMDEQGLREILPKRQIIEVEGLRIGLFHGKGGAAETVFELAKLEFENDKVDVIIFGHTHHPMNEKRNNILFFNPGSPTDTVVAPYRSYGIIEINNKKIDAQIKKITEE